MIRRRALTRGDRRHRRHSSRVPKVRMTSMMDILTVLLLFLLKSFVVDAGVVTPPPDVTLPESTSEDTPEATIVVAISDDAILVGDRPVSSVADALTGEDLLIEPLEAELLRELDRIQELASLRGQEPGNGQVTIQGDRDVEFRLLRRVMYTCDLAGYDRIALAVIRSATGA